MIRSARHNDCGVCALANLKRISYPKALARLHPNWRRKRSFGTTTRMMKIGARAHIKAKLILVRSRSWYDVPDNSLVKVVPSFLVGTRNWHWVVWRDGMVWDSVHACPVTPELYTHYPVSYLGRS
jgi:hypothetical protein